MRQAFFGLLAFIPVAALAQVATDNMTVRITIQAECLVSASEELDFGTVGVLTADVDAMANLQVTCTESTPYDIGLGAGLGAAADTTTRQMTAAGNTINYRLFRDAARSQNWGDTIDTDTLKATGTGAAQTFPVYGRVLAQTTPAPGSYVDTVLVTVTY